MQYIPFSKLPPFPDIAGRGADVNAYAYDSAGQVILNPWTRTPVSVQGATGGNMYGQTGWIVLDAISEWYRQKWAGVRPYVCDQQRDLVVWCDVAHLPAVWCDRSGFMVDTVYSQADQPTKIHFSAVTPHDPRIRPGAVGVLVSREVTGTPILGGGVPTVVRAPMGAIITGNRFQRMDNWTWSLPLFIAGQLVTGFGQVMQDFQSRAVYIAPNGSRWLVFSTDQVTGAQRMTPMPATGIGNVPIDDIIPYLETGGRGNTLVDQLPSLLTSGKLPGILAALTAERKIGGFITTMLKNPFVIASMLLMVAGAAVAIGTFLGPIIAAEAATATAGEAAVASALDASFAAAEGGLTSVEIEAAYAGIISDAVSSGVDLPAGITGAELTSIIGTDDLVAGLQDMGFSAVIENGVTDAGLVTGQGLDSGAMLSGSTWGPGVDAGNIGLFADMPETVSGQFITTATAEATGAVAGPPQGLSTFQYLLKLAGTAVGCANAAFGGGGPTGCIQSAAGALIAQLPQGAQDFLVPALKVGMVATGVSGLLQSGATPNAIVASPANGGVVLPAGGAAITSKLPPAFRTPRTGTGTTISIPPGVTSTNGTPSPTPAPAPAPAPGPAPAGTQAEPSGGTVALMLGAAALLLVGGRS